MKKISEMTMVEMLEALENNVEEYNNSTDATHRIELAAQATELVTAYNEAALLSAYAECMADAQPVVALAKMFYCAKISVKDSVHKEQIQGKTVVKVTRAINDGTQRLNVMKFLDWAAERNKMLAADKGWKAACNACRDTINSEWKAYVDSANGVVMSKTKVRNAVQKMFDALAYVPAVDKNGKATGRNALIAKTPVATYIIAAAADAKASIDAGNKKVSHSLTFLNATKFATLVMDILHMTVEGKDYTIVYGDPVEEETTEEKAKGKKPEAKTEPEASK